MMEQGRQKLINVLKTIDIDILYFNMKSLVGLWGKPTTSLSISGDTLNIRVENLNEYLLQEPRWSWFGHNTELCYDPFC